MKDETISDTTPDTTNDAQAEAIAELEVMRRRLALLEIAVFTPKAPNLMNVFLIGFLAGVVWVALSERT